MSKETISMKEAVAREIAHQRAIRMVEANGGDPLRIKAWNVDARDRQDATAAIKAMREPSPAMVDKAWSLITSNLRYEEAYRHMIDAALSQE